MAGSLKAFNYEADDGEIFHILSDESNIETVNAGNVTPVTPAAKYKLPGNVRPRRAVFQSAGGEVRRTVILLNAAAAAANVPGTNYVDPTSGLTVSLKAVEGELVRLPSLSDTGLTDGDDD